MVLLRCGAWVLVLEILFSRASTKQTSAPERRPGTTMRLSRSGCAPAHNRVSYHIQLNQCNARNQQLCSLPVAAERRRQRSSLPRRWSSHDGVSRVPSYVLLKPSLPAEGAGSFQDTCVRAYKSTGLRISFLRATTKKWAARARHSSRLNGEDARGGPEKLTRALGASCQAPGCTDYFLCKVSLDSFDSRTVPPLKGRLRPDTSYFYPQRLNTLSAPVPRHHRTCDKVCTVR